MKHIITVIMFVVMMGYGSAHYEEAKQADISTGFTLEQMQRFTAVSSALGDWMGVDAEIKISTEKNEVRGTAGGNVIHLYPAEMLNALDFIFITIHELAHVYDYESRASRWDDSALHFYKLSRDDFDERKGGHKEFVTHYSMTNAAEDFAETMTYYIMNNKGIRCLAKDDEVLQKKVDYFDQHFGKRLVDGFCVGHKTYGSHTILNSF